MRVQPTKEVDVSTGTNQDQDRPSITVDLADGKQAAVVFKHGERQVHRRDKSPRRETTVSIKIMDGETVMSSTEGVSRCNPSDNFSKAVGRLLALRRAMDQGGFSADHRKILAEKLIVPEVEKIKKQRQPRKK